MLIGCFLYYVMCGSILFNRVYSSMVRIFVSKANDPGSNPGGPAKYLRDGIS